MPLRGFSNQFPYETTIQLLNVPWSDYSNLRGFRSLQEQQTYMDNHVVKTMNACKYQPKEDVISYSGYMDEIYEKVNYLRWRNPLPSGGVTNWRYAFITSMEARGMNTTWIHFHVDAVETFMFDWEVKQCYIDRQFTKQKTNGVVTPQTEPESVYYGNEYQIAYEMKNYFGVNSLTDMCFVIASRYSLEADAGTVENPKLVSVATQNVDGIPQCLGYYVCDGGLYDSLFTVVEKLQDKPWVTAGFQNIWMIPNTILQAAQIKSISSPLGFSIGKINGQLANIELNVPNFRDHFTHNSPETWKNTKMYCYPYSFIEMCTFTGETFIIKPELIPGNDLKVLASTHIGGEVRTAFQLPDYGGGSVGEGMNAGLQFASYPQLPIQVDSYYLGLAQTANARATAINNLTWKNRTNTITSGASGLVSGALKGAAVGASGGTVIPGIGTAVGAVGGAILGGLQSGINTGTSLANLYQDYSMAIDSIQAQVEDAKLRQDTVAGQWGGSEFMFAHLYNGLTLRWKTITNEYLPRVSRYFDIVGYKINDLAVPNIDGNPYYNYIKLAVANITGPIPEEEMNEIKEAFKNGITFWWTDDLYNYAVDNTI